MRLAFHDDMARKTLIRSTEFPYHVTARGNNREHFPGELFCTWKVFNEHLDKISSLYSAKIHAFVLMPNHFHLLISTPREDLGVVMQYFMWSLTKTLNSRTGRSGRMFGAKYHWSLVTTDLYYDCVVKYVYRNPVKAQLSNRVEDYPFSTFTQLLGQNSCDFQLHPRFGDSSLVPSRNIKEFALWLNQPFLTEEDEQIKKSLMKTRFMPARVGARKKVFSLDAAGIRK